MSDGAMETAEYMQIDIWRVLDSIFELCHKTAEIHFSGMSCSIVSTQNETLLWLTKMKKAKNGTYCKAKYRIPNMVKQGRMYSKHN